jgi:predicted N-acetyltransferase YhbS
MAVIIREAETEDILEVTKILREFSGHYPIKTAQSHFHAPSIARLLNYALVNGCVIVAEDTKTKSIVGTFVAMIEVNMWTEMSKQLREVAWYVKKDYRKSKVGIDLYKRYLEISDYYLDEGIVSISLMGTSAESGSAVEEMVKRDFQQLETSYFKGG